MMKTFMSAALFTAMAAIVSVNAAASQEFELGHPVGEQIPHSLGISGQPGFNDLIAENGMVLFFVRSINWCPFCKNQVINISAKATEFEERGLALVFVSYDPAEDQQKFKTQKDIQASLISDPESEIIRAFGLLNENYEPGSFAYGVPHPAIFFIDQAGIIQGKLHEDDYLSDRKSYQNRPPFQIVLEEADRLIKQ